MSHFYCVLIAANCVFSLTPSDGSEVLNSMKPVPVVKPEIHSVERGICPIAKSTLMELFL